MSRGKPCWLCCGVQHPAASRGPPHRHGVTARAPPPRCGSGIGVLRSSASSLALGDGSLMSLWPRTHPCAASGAPERMGAGWGLHMEPAAPASPSCLPAPPRSSGQLVPALRAVGAQQRARSFPRAWGCGERKAWGGESGVTPHPARPISRGRAGRKEARRALQGAASGAGASVAPGSLARCTWAPWHLRSQHRRGHMAPVCLGRCWATFPSPRGPSGSGRGLRKHERTGSGRKPPSTELCPAGAGA